MELNTCCALKRPENTHLSHATWCACRMFFQVYLFNSNIIIILKLCVKKPWYALSYKFMCIYISHPPHIFGYQTSTKFCRIFNPSTVRGPCWSWREDCCFCVQCTAIEFILEVHPMRSSRSVTQVVLQCFSTNPKKAQWKRQVRHCGK